MRHDRLLEKTIIVVSFSTTMGRPQLQAPAAASEDRNEQPPNSVRPRATSVLALHRRLVATLVWQRLLGLVAVPRQKLISVAAKVEKQATPARAPPVSSEKVVKFADEMDLPIATAILYDDQHSRVHIIPPSPSSSSWQYQSPCAEGRAKAQRTLLKRPSSLSSAAVQATDEIDQLSSSLVAITTTHDDDEEECSCPHTSTTTTRHIMYDDQHRRVHVAGCLPSSYQHERRHGENIRAKPKRKHFLKRPLSSSSSSSSSYERAEF
jgi:hypothetical protein